MLCSVLALVLLTAAASGARAQEAGEVATLTVLSPSDARVPLVVCGSVLTRSCVGTAEGPPPKATPSESVMRGAQRDPLFVIDGRVLGFGRTDAGGFPFWTKDAPPSVVVLLAEEAERRFGPIAARYGVVEITTRLGAPRVGPPEPVPAALSIARLAPSSRIAWAHVFVREKGWAEVEDVFGRIVRARPVDALVLRVPVVGWAPGVYRLRVRAGADDLARRLVVM